MKKPKSYTIRYYRARFGADGKQGSLSALLQKISTDKDKIGAIREAGSMVHQIRVHQVISPTHVNAFFVRFRDELPLVGQRTSSQEHPPKLEPNDEVLEKNHFSLFVEENGVEVVAYQVSMEGSDIRDLGRYFTQIAGGLHVITFDEVVTADSLLLLQNGLVKSVEFEIARPRSKYFAPDPNDTWTRDSINFMNSTGATRYKAKIVTKSQTKGLIGDVKNHVIALLKSNQTKMLKVKLSDVDHPIDLFADRVFDRITVEISEGLPNSDQVFGEILAAKKVCTGLDAYLAKDNEALD